MIASLAPLAGILITTMNMLNSRLSGRMGSLASVLTIHLVGIAALALVFVIRQAARALGANRARGGASAARVGVAREGVSLPAYAYLGGVVGVATVFTSAYSYGLLGASLAVALGLIGQTSFSLIVDATGAFGRLRRPLAWRRLPGIGVVAAGAVCMAGNWRSDLPALFAALFAGVAVGTSSVLNSMLGQARGLLKATATNYITGISATLLIVIATAPSAEDIRRAGSLVVAAGPLLAMGGGLLGVVSVGTMSFLFSHLPAFTATILVFAGQSLCGLALDAASGIVNGGKLAGTFFVILGLALDMTFARDTRNRR